MHLKRFIVITANVISVVPHSGFATCGLQHAQLTSYDLSAADVDSIFLLFFFFVS